MKKKIAFLLALIMVVCSFAACGSGKKVKVIDIALTDEEYAFGVDKDQPELLTKTNEFIDKIMSDGTFEDICNKYFGDGTPTPVKSAALDASKDQLVVATNAAFEPFEYTAGDSYLGIDLEIAAALAKYLGKELVISNMSFDAVCLSVGQHKADIAMAGLTVKEERKEFVDFTKSYYKASQKVIVLESDKNFDTCKTAANVETVLKSLKDATCGVQAGTTGNYYAVGDPEWGFDGFDFKTVTYANGSLAVQDLINGNINMVIIDAAPADCITKAINEVQ